MSSTYSNLLFLVLFYCSISVATSQAIFDIIKFGAKPNGDATLGLLGAWKAACGSPKASTILVPKGEYRLGPISLTGPCKGPVKMDIHGNFKAPADPAVFKKVDTWVKIERVKGLTVVATKGAGVFDGQGHLAWKSSNCLENPKCHSLGGLPYNFRFNFLTNSDMGGLTSLNSKSFHMALLGCDKLNLHDFTITAPGTSPNTDGIHIGRSDNVNISSFNIKTGDDCVSIGDGARNLLVEKVTCGPGHGISIGSLGRYPEEEAVKGVTVRNCTMIGTDNGVRVKTWHASFKSTATGLHFEDIIVDNVKTAILVDQEYCPYDKCKAKTPSNVKLEDVLFKNIRGTTQFKEAVKLICSTGASRCEKVQLSNIDITHKGRDGPALFQCKNVKPFLTGKIIPKACGAPLTLTPVKGDA